MNGRMRGLLRLVLLFLGVLTASAVFFTLANTRSHERIDAVAHEACHKDAQLARNQRRVLVTLIEMTKETHPELQPDLQIALALVPQFDC